MKIISRIFTHMPSFINGIPYYIGYKITKNMLRKEADLIWPRNSFMFKNVAIGLSDIDLTVVYNYEVDREKVERLRKKYIYLKKLIPFLGEINLFTKYDIEKMGKFANSLELARDPILCFKFKNIRRQVSESQRIIYIIRMLEADVKNLIQRPNLRLKKWKFHLKQLGEDSSKLEKITSLGDLIEYFDQIIFSRVEQLQIKNFLTKYLATQRDESEINRFYDEKAYIKEFMILMPHRWLGASMSSGNYKSDLNDLQNLSGDAVDLFIEQIKWEIWGLTAQFRMMGDNSTFEKHLINIKEIIRFGGDQGKSIEMVIEDLIRKNQIFRGEGLSQ